jgi:hypothetical protein
VDSIPGERKYSRRPQEPVDQSDDIRTQRMSRGTTGREYPDYRRLSPLDYLGRSVEYDREIVVRRRQAPNAHVSYEEVDPKLELELLDKVELARIHGRNVTLSYCAGTPEDSAIIFVNGVIFHAFANLRHAIDMLVKGGS